MEMLRYAYCYKLMQIEAQEQNSLTKKKRVPTWEEPAWFSLGRKYAPNFWVEDDSTWGTRMHEEAFRPNQTTI
jgi:hypothetical protein